MPDPDLLKALRPVVAAVSNLGVRYYVGGSAASSLYGKARQTLDVDLVAELSLHHVGDLIAELAEDYYISEASVTAAIASRRCFNLIHNETAFKVDIFVPQDRDYDRAALKRIREHRIGDSDSSITVFVASPEDVVVKKLEWYRLGNEVSQQQWEDVAKVIELQGRDLDTAYMRRWANEIGVDDLLERILEQALPPGDDSE